MRNTFIYESKRLLGNIMVVAFMIMYLTGFRYYVNTGIDEYKNQNKEEAVFLNKESLQVEQYTNYEQYGGRGIKVITQSSPLDVLMNRNCLRQKEKARLNSSEEIDIDESKRLKDHFKYEARIKGAADLFLIFGTLFTILLGFTNFKGKGEIELIEKMYLVVISALSRIIIILIYFGLTYLMYNYLLSSNDIRLNANEQNLYLQYLLYTAILIILCYASGLCFSFIKRRDIAFLIALIYWVCMAFVLPEIYDNYTVSDAQKIRSNVDLNLDKMTELMKIEKKAVAAYVEIKNTNKTELLEKMKTLVKQWTDNGFVENEKKEDDVLNRVKKTIKKAEKLSLIYPTLFYYHMSREISSAGDRRYIAFDEKIRLIRNEFLNYYLSKRYETWGKGVESYIKTDENIVTISIDLTDMYLKGLIAVFAVLGVFVLLIWLQLRSILKENFIVSNKRKITLEKGKIYFKLFKTADDRNQEFYKYQQDKRNVCLNLPAIEEYSIDTSIRSYIKYWCYVRRINTDKVLENLNILGINTDSIKTQRKGEEFFNKIYAALVLTNNAGTYIINDYLKTASKEFDRQFRLLIKQYQEKDNKTIIYLSTEVCTAELRKDLLHKRSNGYTEIDVNAVILR